MQWEGGKYLCSPNGPAPGPGKREEIKFRDSFQPFLSLFLPVGSMTEERRSPVRPSLAFRSVRSSDSQREDEEEKEEEEETKIIDSVIKKGRGKRKKSRGIVVVVVGQKKVNNRPDS